MVAALATNTLNTLARRARRTSAVGAIQAAAYTAGGLALALEAAIHAEQFAALFSGVAWIGPLFIANAVACFVVIAGLAYTPTRRFAALAGVGISTLALLSLVVSYAQGLFGYQEGGFRPEVAIAAYTEAGAVLALSAALAFSNATRSRES